MSNWLTARARRVRSPANSISGSRPEVQEKARPSRRAFFVNTSEKLLRVRLTALGGAHSP